MIDNPVKSPRLRSPARAMVYTAVVPALREVARQHGYALAVHGSMATDLDLLACPWIDEAAPAEALIEGLREAVGGYIRPAWEGDHNPTDKPHGRRAWSIYTDPEGFGPYLDVSVMPRLSGA
jgi:hypothetical protein